jgi:multiple sugar transport system permease protein
MSLAAPMAVRGAGNAGLRRRWRRHRDWVWPVLFLLPGAILFGMVIVQSTVESLWISLHDWDGIGDKVWVGLAN